MFSSIRALSEFRAFVEDALGWEYDLGRCNGRDADMDATDEVAGLVEEVGIETTSTASFRRLLLSRSANSRFPCSHSSFAVCLASSSSATKLNDAGKP